MKYPLKSSFSLGMVFAAAVVMVGLTSISCATTAASRRPDWVDLGQHEEYPERKFMTGVGQGDTREKAADRARAEISKRFSVSVESKTVAIESTWIQNDNGARSENSTGVYSDGVSTSSKIQLEDLTIAETWFDKKVVQYYALAVLNRAKAFDRVEDAISAILEDVEAVMGQAEAETDSLRKAGRWATAMRIFARLDPYLVQARVLNPNWTPAYPSDASEGSLRRAFEAAAKEVRVFVNVVPEETKLSERVKGVFRDVMTSSGMVCVDNESDASVRLFVELNAKDSGKTPSGYEFTEIEAAVSLYLNGGTEVFASTTRKVREGGLNGKQARATAEDWIIKDIARGFLGFLYQSVLK
jgi:hypothetical protein